MYFVTMFCSNGDKEHVGPFDSRQQGIDWAQAAIKRLASYYSGRWSNEFMASPDCQPAL